MADQKSSWESKERSCGVLLHLASLPSRWGVGDMGRGAGLFLDFLLSSGQALWQILPLSPTDSAQGHSPYSGLSAFAGNPLFISPELLVEDDLLEVSDLEDHGSVPEGSCRYGAAAVIKRSLFQRAFERSSDLSDAEYRRFREENAFWLDDYALFRSLKRRLALPWYEWSPPLRDRDEDALAEATRDLDDEIKLETFLQFLFFRQWDRLRGLCRERGIRIIGDVPVYISHDSADVWVHRELFNLDATGNLARVAGVPPDCFSAKGQRWDNPVYRWDVLEGEHFHWWLKRLRHGVALFDLVRIDHFRGLVKFWSIPAGENSVASGAWTDASPEAFFKAVWESIPGLPFIAEDLGYITPDVTEHIRRLGIPGTLVLQFAFGPGFEKSPYAPRNHGENACVFTGTHDNNTARGWFESEADPLAREQLSVLAGGPVTGDKVSLEMIDLALSSRARFALYPMQDILGLGGEARLNTPGKSSGNWLWRIKGEQLRNAPSGELAVMAARHGRRSPGVTKARRGGVMKAPGK